jgi:hypothetical protein
MSRQLINCCQVPLTFSGKIKPVLLLPALSGTTSKVIFNRLAFDYFSKFHTNYNRMKHTFVALLAGMLFASSAEATVTLQFNGSFNTGILSNLANAAGTVSNGMRWGVIISTADASFAGSGTNYDAYAAGVTSSGFLSFGGGVTDDYYIPGTLTADSSALLEGDFTTAGGNGSIVDDLAGIALTGDLAGLGLGAGITSGDRFALIWFSDNTSLDGSSYGLITDPSFVIPSNGALQDYGAAFAGPDSIRPANNTFGATVIPEPSRMMLLGFGLVGLFFRRRR